MFSRESQISMDDIDIETTLKSYSTKAKKELGRFYISGLYIEGAIISKNFEL